MDDILQQLSRLLRGYNYQVILGFAPIKPAGTLEEAKKCIIDIFEDANPEEYEIKEISKSEFFGEIDYGFYYSSS